jgi:hypothetical protein
LVRFTTFLLGVALVTTACRAESVTRVRIESNGAASLVSEVAFDDEALELIGEEGDTPEDVLAALAEVIDPGALPVARPGVVPVRFDRGELKGLRVTFEDLTPAEIAQQVTSGSSLLQDLRLAVADGRLRVEGSTRVATPAELGRLREAAPGDISEVLAITLALEVPGVTSHNATRVEGDVYQWDLLPAVTELREVSFRLTADVGPEFELGEESPAVVAGSQPADEEETSGTSLLAIVLGVVVAGAIGLVVVRRLSRI